MRVLWVILAVFISGCGCSTPVIDKRLKPHYERFMQVSRNIGVPAPERDDLSIYFHNMGEDGPAGQCRSYSGRNPEVRVNTILVDYVETYLMEYIIFHELGHCLLGLNHDEVLVLEKPFSMMYPKIVDLDHYRRHREAYWMELFTRPRGDLWR